MKDTPVKICKHCGKEILIITKRLYRYITVDAEAVEVVPDPKGEQFIRFMDGSKIKARPISMDEAIALERGSGKNVVEYAYRQHHCDEV